MCPMVPSHDLPRLQALIGHDLPAPGGSTTDARCGMGPALRRQRRDGEHITRRTPTARPDREDLRVAAPGTTA